MRSERHDDPGRRRRRGEARPPAPMGLGAGRRADGGMAFPVAPAEAFAAGSAPWTGVERAHGILALAPRAAGGAWPGATPAATTEERLPPHGWRRGVPLPPGALRDERLFVLPWRGVAPREGSGGEEGLLDPSSVFTSREGAPLPAPAGLAGEAEAALDEVARLAAAISVTRRLRGRIARLADRCGVGTPAGIRVRLGLTHVQWPLLVGASEEELLAAFRGLVARGELLVDGRSLTVPWEAWGGFVAALAADPGGPADAA